MSSDPATERASTALRGLRVMVADDEEDFRELLTTLLRPLGVSVCHAVDGNEVLERVDQDRHDVVLLDQRLPRLLGTEVAEELRARGCTVPVVLLTASPDARHLARSAGIRHWLAKPFEVDDLCAVLRRALGGAD